MIWLGRRILKPPEGCAPSPEAVAQLYRKEGTQLMSDVDDADLIGQVCWRPDCHQLVMVPLAAARPTYCSPDCEEAADEEYEAAKERVAHLRDLLRRSRHWVAAFGRGDPGPTEGPEQAAREALAFAQGTLDGMTRTGGPQTDRERHVSQALSDLVTAVDPLVEEGA